MKVEIDRNNKRWDKVNPPRAGSLVAITGKLIGREEDDTGLFIIGLRTITYIPSTSRPSPTKSPTSTKPGRGKTWGQSQRDSKAKRPRSDDDHDKEKGSSRKRPRSDDEDDKGESSSTSPPKRLTTGSRSAAKPT